VSGWGKIVAMKVLHFPRDRNPYGNRLNDALATEGVDAGYLENLFSSSTLNILVLPFRSLRMYKNVEVLHIHWLFPFALHWAQGSSLRYLMRMWCGVWLWSLRRMGIKIVWTAHNFLPHNAIFDDDRAARQMLVRNADIVIAFDQTTARLIEQEFQARHVDVILPAAEPQPGVDYQTARSRLAIQPHEQLIVLLGIMAPYKGTDQALRVITEWADLHPSEVNRLKVVVAGVPSDVHTRTQIEELVLHLRSKKVDVETRFERISDEEIDTYYSAADVTLLLFRMITNSSSLSHALASGTPVIVNSFASLEGFASAATLVVHNQAEALDALDKVLSWTTDERGHARAAAREWASLRTWKTVGEQTAALYQGVVTS